jgi:hypothetical protein
MSNTIRFVVIMLIFTFLAGFYIVPTQSMPNNARVFLDDGNKTYFSPACAKKSGEKPLRPATAAEARRLKYAPDQSCGGEAGFRQEGRSLAGNFLVRLGMLPPLPSRWNKDGSWNW